MNRRGFRGLLTIAGPGLLTLALGCGDVSQNDFGQTLSFDGFFAETPCSTGVATAVAFTELPATDGDPNCTLGSLCIVALQVTNKTTGRPIPTQGGQGSTGGSPVPTTRGVRILPKNLHIEYSLPIGELPARDYVMAGNIDPLGKDCREFPLLAPEDTVAMVQDPLSYPATPFFARARVTYEGVTAGGLAIETHGDLDIQIF